MTTQGLGRVRGALAGGLLWIANKIPPLGRLVGRVAGRWEARRRVRIGELRPVLERFAGDMQRLRLEADVILRGLEWERGARVGLSFHVLAMTDELALYVGRGKLPEIRRRLAARANRMIDGYNARLAESAANRCLWFNRDGEWQQAELGDPCVHEREHEGDHETGIQVARRAADLSDGPRIITR